MTARALALSGLLIALALPASAVGATASAKVTSYREDDWKGGFYTVTSTTIVYAAEPGEANTPVLTLSPDGRILTIAQAGAPLTAGTGCSGDGAGQVRCEAAPAGTVSLEIGLGDGDDVLAAFSSGPVGVKVDAGPGADKVDLFNGEVAGGDGDDVLRGTAHSVSLLGGAGEDVLLGGPEGDTLDGGPGRDHLDGGDGLDTVAWTTETAPVNVDLGRAGPAGIAAQPDEVRNFESARGGQGDDVLRGSAAINSLSGGNGDDRLEGLDGADVLNAGAGADQMLGGDGNDELVNGYTPSGESDRLEGGAGDDLLRNQSGGSVMLGGAGADVLSIAGGTKRTDGGAGDDRLNVQAGTPPASMRCGSGRDRVSGLLEDTLVPTDCELVGRDDDELAIGTRASLRGTTLRVPVPWLCYVVKTCPLRVVVRVGARRVALGARTLRRHDGQSIAIRLSPRARHAIRTALRIRLDYSSRGGQQPFSVTVRAPRG